MGTKRTTKQNGRSESGRKGGMATAAKLGRSFFSEIGRKGGTARGRKENE